MTNMTGSKLSPKFLPLHRLQIRFSLIILRQRPTSIGSLWFEVLKLTSENCSLSSNTYRFHPSTHISPRLRLGPIWGSRDDNQVNMEMPMY
jgi:hypothetical protein